MAGTDKWIVRRNGVREPASLDKIRWRLEDASTPLTMRNVSDLALRILHGLGHGDTSSSDLEEYMSETCAHKAAEHPDYEKMAVRISVASLHRRCALTLQGVVDENRQVLSERYENAVRTHGALLDASVNHSADMRLTYFGLKTLERSGYLLRGESPQLMFARVALALRCCCSPESECDEINEIAYCFQLMSWGYYVHATPTLMNAGKKDGQLSSCFLAGGRFGPHDDAFESLRQVAKLSASGAGVGIDLHEAGGAKFGPLLKLLDAACAYNNGAELTSRPGAFAVYVEPWHGNVFEFLAARRQNGSRDLFYALWIPDLFMKRVKADAEWSIGPDAELASELSNSWGEEFERAYENARPDRFERKVKARDVWNAAVSSMIETGMPYVMYKDACNAQCNTEGRTVRCSNLCAEVVQPSDGGETAVCTLASVALNRFVERGGSFDYELLEKVVGSALTSLDRVVDVCHYPIESAGRSAERHRAVGIGVQGFADALSEMNLEYDSEGAREFNKLVFETIYYAALRQSCDLAATKAPHPSFAATKIAKTGQFHHDGYPDCKPQLPGWDKLRRDVAKNGLRNAFVTVVMPTASTAHIMGNSESVEPYISNLFSRTVRSASYVVTNPNLAKKLTREGRWNGEVRRRLLLNDGSAKEESPLFATAWEIDGERMVDMAADRQPYVDQSQSSSAFIENPTHKIVTDRLFYAWRRGLKTGLYYLRSRAAAKPTKLSIGFDGSCCGC